MTRRIHPVAGALALLLITTFWSATLVSELLLGPAQVVAVKRAIPWGLLLLIPAMAATGGSGFRLAGGRRQGLLGVKARRMQVIAANGLLVLVPMALLLAQRAGAGRFDATFYTLQAVELLAGAVNITLLVLNMRDGLRMTRVRRARA
ncbi:hypothetical protein [Pseudooceanicola nanhaiensis]|uniref:hypothetical protein n=1 Tax=Pseudooceanicola nanhaiensis TaxID=375761 RepID=UPI001CD1C524|nr:hypothetical protein [Pseudooceanicola nanhaiensis]MCA0921575.1 hypothetical protein [Pseudooceanicola nanhaiensis]